MLVPSPPVSLSSSLIGTCTCVGYFSTFLLILLSVMVELLQVPNHVGDLQMPRPDVVDNFSIELYFCLAIFDEKSPVGDVRR